MQFVTVVPNSAIALHIQGRNSTSHKDSFTTTHMPNTKLKNVNISTHSLMNILFHYPVMDLGDCCKTIYFSLSTDTKLILERSLRDKSFWDDCRKFRVTGSRCYELFTYNKTLKTDEQWSLKASRYFWPKLFTNKAVQHGLKYENKVREMYAKDTGFDILECGLVINPLNPWLGYTPDGIIVDTNCIPIKLIEIKCPFKGKVLNLNDLVNNLIFIVKNNNGLLSLKQNHSYYAQVQMGMVMLNVNTCDFIVYSSYEDTYVVINVMYDEIYCKNMFFKLKIIYFERLLHNICIITKNKD